MLCYIPSCAGYCHSKKTLRPIKLSPSAPLFSWSHQPIFWDGGSNESNALLLLFGNPMEIPMGKINQSPQSPVPWVNRGLVLKSSAATLEGTKLWPGSLEGTKFVLDMSWSLMHPISVIKLIHKRYWTSTYLLAGRRSTAPHEWLLRSNRTIYEMGYRSTCCNIANLRYPLDPLDPLDPLVI